MVVPCVTAERTRRERCVTAELTCRERWGGHASAGIRGVAAVCYCKLLASGELQGR